MKKKTKLVFVLVMIATLIISLAVYAFAKTNTQDGLEATIITDKKSYSYGDDVVVKISVKNTNERIVKNVSIEGMIPEGLKLKESNSLKNQSTELQPGETLDLTFVAVLDKTEESTDQDATNPDETEEVTDCDTTDPDTTDQTTDYETTDPNVTTPSEDSTVSENETTSTAPETTSKKENITTITDDAKDTTGYDGNYTNDNTKNQEVPNTGASRFSTVIFVALITISAIAIVACRKTRFRKSASKVISIIICVLIASSGVFELAFKAGAFESDRKSFVISETIMMDDKNYKLSGRISFDELADDNMIETIDEVTESIMTLQKSNDYKNALTEDKIAQMKRLLERCEKQKKVKNIRYSNASGEEAFLFDYGNGGSGGVIIESKHSNDCFSSSSCAENMYDSAIPLATNIKREIVTEENKSWTFIFGASKEDETSYKYLSSLSEQYRNLGESVSLIQNVTVDSYKELSGNSLIYIMSHGSFREGKSYICTDEEATNEKEYKYESDLEKRDVEVFVTDNIVKHFWIRSSFFTSNYQNNDLDNSIVLVSCCCFYGDNNKEDYSFANAFCSIGAKAVIGFCNSVGQTYSNCFLENVIYNLSQGLSIKNAFDSSKELFGDNENVFYELLDSDNLKKEIPAYPIFQGDNDFGLKEEPIEGFGTLMATVKDADTNEPIEGVAVYAYKEGNKSLYHISKTNKNGVFSLNLPEGEYVCGFKHKSYNNIELPIRVTKGVITYYFEDIYLVSKANTFTGKILDSKTKQPILNAKIKVFEEKNGAQVLVDTKKTSSNGEFELSLPRGAYTLEFEHEDYASGYSEISIPADTGLIKKFYLVPKGSAMFYVKDEDGNNISSASVSVYEKETLKQVVSGVTDINGQILFSSLNAGEYVAEFSKSDYESKKISVLIENSKDTFETVVLSKKEATGDSYVKIYTLTDFKKIVSAPSKNYILMNDINLNGNSPCNSITFTGIFDGNGYSIKNSNGMIFLVNKGTIKNLALENVSYKLNVGHQYASFTYGVIARDNYGTIKNCIVKPGAIVVNRANVAADANCWTELFFGGIAGRNMEAGVIEDCINSANITINGTGAAIIGGIAASNDGTIRHCLNTGNLCCYVIGGVNPPVAYVQSGVSGISSRGTVVNCGNAANKMEATVSGANNPSAFLDIIGNRNITGVNYAYDGMTYEVNNYYVPSSAYLCKENVTFADNTIIRKEWNYNF